MARLLYAVDDDPTILTLLEGNLTAAGYEVRAFSEGESFLRDLNKHAPDMALLDWMLPGMDGLEVCRRLRAHPVAGNTPVILLTARDTEADLIVGLESGADDYIAKPFSIRELQSRMQAIFRRVDRLRDAPLLSLRAHGVRMEDSSRRVWWQGKEVALTLKEYELLRCLMQARGRALTREYLLDTIWGMDYQGGIRTVDVHVMQLRKRIPGCDAIETLRGVGYRFIEGGQDA